MAENDAPIGDESPEAEGTQSGSPEPEGTDASALVASYRKRQAGAEAARQAAEAKAKELADRLAAYEAKNRTAEDQETATLAALQERLTAAEQRAAEAEAKANARILDARFPNARKELPEVTDEVRLAKFEAMLADGDDFTESPTPLRHNESKTSAPRAGSKPETAADVRARLESMPLPEGWN